MENKEKIHFHSIGKVFFDMLRDPNSNKYSLTKISAFGGLLLLSGTVIMSLIIMWQKKEIDHVLLVELIGFILTLEGFKNNFGFKTSGDNQTVISDANPDGKPADAADVKQLINDVTNEKG
jgi:hypothetical protein